MRPGRAAPEPVAGVVADGAPSPPGGWGATPAPREVAIDVLRLVLALVALALWDASGLDRELIRAFGSEAGFAWRDHWLTEVVAHQGGRMLAWGVALALAFNVWRPLPFARGLSRHERVWWLATTLLCVALIPLLKRASLTSCPWSLAEFGGTAQYVSHWSLGQADGGSGGCFPSGHASSAFGFLAGWFALRRRQPGAARAWLAVVLVLGAALGWAQMMRGAHYASHTMWTAWVCLLVATVSYHGDDWWRRRAR